VALPAGKTAKITLSPPIVAHRGCGFYSGTHAVAFDLNTVGSSVPMQQYVAAASAPMIAHGAKQISVGGNSGYSFTVGPIQEVAFYKGQTRVVVSASNAKPAAALTIATLIASRM
jgi:hypothetical protein